MYCWCEWNYKYKEIQVSCKMFHMLGSKRIEYFSELHFLKTEVQIKRVVEQAEQATLISYSWVICLLSSNNRMKTSKEKFTPFLCSKYQSRQELCLSFSLVENKQNKTGVLRGIYKAE